MPSTYWSYDADDIRHLPQGVSLWKYRKGSTLPILKVLQSSEDSVRGHRILPISPHAFTFQAWIRAQGSNDSGCLVLQGGWL